MRQKNDGNIVKKGFLYVASLRRGYYLAAKNSALSLLDYFPEAKITLFTHEEWVEDEDYEIFENIITDGVPRHHRAKLWALDKTPYDITAYLDCDTEIVHEDITTIFDQIPKNVDIIFTANRPYNAAITKLSNTEEMTEHCGLFVYRHNPKTINLMSAWWGEYLKQQEPGYDHEHYPKEALEWDTFTMWRLLTYGNMGVKTGRFPDPDARWNFVIGYKEEELKGQPKIIHHYTLPPSIRNA
jgi:hypothetical protein